MNIFSPSPTTEETHSRKTRDAERELLKKKARVTTCQNHHGRDDDDDDDDGGGGGIYIGFFGN